MINLRSFLAALAVFVTSNALGTDAGPAFNCNKASTRTERMICSTPALAEQDRRLDRVYKAYLDEFAQDPGPVKSDQAAWLKARNRCEEDVACLGQAYRSRLDLLEGRSPSMPAAGIFGVKNIGSLALYPMNGKYLSHIQTAEPSQGRWTCDLQGIASGSGTDLKFVSSEDDVSFPLRLSTNGTIIIDSDAAARISAQCCGLNGSISFKYVRQPFD